MEAIDFGQFDLAGDGFDAEEAARYRPAHSAPGPVLARAMAEADQEPSFIDGVIDRIKAAGKRVDDINFGVLAAQFLGGYGITDAGVIIMMAAWIRDLVDPAVDDAPKGSLMYPRLTAAARADKGAFNAFQRVMNANRIVSIGLPDLTVPRFTPRIAA